MVAATVRKSLTLVLAALIFAPSLASAQANNDAAAESLFLEGRRLLDEGKTSEACAKFQASDKAAPSVGARMNVGDCSKVLGRTATAWTAYKSAENLARKNGDSTRQAESAAAAGLLLPQLTYVKVAVSGPARVPGLAIKLAGADLAAALWGERVPVDPGSVSVEATAPKHSPRTLAIETLGAAQTATLELPILEKVPEPEKPIVGPAVVPTAPPTDDPTQPVDEDPGRSRRLLALGVGGGGVALTVLGIGFGLAASSAYSDRKPHCDTGVTPNQCNDIGAEFVDTAKFRATVSTVLVGAGLVAVGVGAGLYFTAPKERQTTVGVTATSDGVGMTVMGSF